MIWHKLVIHLVVHVLFLMQVLFDVLALWILEGLHLIVAFLILHHLIHRVFIAIIFVRLLLVFHGFILLLEVVSLGHLFVLLLRLALLAGLLVRLWRVDFAWHVLLVAISDIIVVLACILTYAFSLLRKVIQFFHHVFLGCLVVKELQSLLRLVLIIDLHNSVFALNIFWVLLDDILLLDLFDLLHVRTLL